MATFPRAANPSQQPSDPEDEDLSLDEYDLYGLAHSYQGKTWPCLPPGPSPSNPHPYPQTRLPPWTSPHTSPLSSQGVLYPSSHPLLTPLPLSAVLLGPGASHTPRILEATTDHSGGPSFLRWGTGIMTAPKLCADDPPSLPTPTQALPPTPTLPTPCLSFEASCLCPPHLGLLPGFPGVGGRKGRTKREAAANTNHPSPGGHERKLVTKLQNTERKKRGARP
uniref:Nuclear protein 1 n=1 Tax=Equus caballus TaxID=9796 RepID=A0A9L0TF37_HORSE